MRQVVNEVMEICAEVDVKGASKVLVSAIDNMSNKLTKLLLGCSTTFVSFIVFHVGITHFSLATSERHECMRLKKNIVTIIDKNVDKEALPNGCGNFSVHELKKKSAGDREKLLNCASAGLSQYFCPKTVPAGIIV